MITISPATLAFSFFLSSLGGGLVAFACAEGMHRLEQWMHARNLERWARAYAHAGNKVRR